jgi:hypothetical protein
MEVSEAIALAREKSESMSRLARVLSRLKPTIYATGTTVRFRDDEMNFFCATESDAQTLATVIPSKLNLAYRGAGSTLYGTVHVQGVDYNFTIPTIRQVRLGDCVLKRKRRAVSGWFTAILLFNDLEIAKLDYRDRKSSPKLKEELWNIALRQKREKQRLERFDFVL